MKLLGILLLCVVGVKALAEDVKSNLMKQAICQEVIANLDDEGQSLSEEVEEDCPDRAEFFVVKDSKKYKAYTGDDIEIKIGSKKISYNKNQKFLYRLKATFKADSFICETLVTRLLPRFSISKDIHFLTSNFKVDVIECSVEGEGRLKKVKPGDSNLKVISKLPKKVRQKISETYDLVPMIGYDGYYGQLERSVASILDSEKNVIGYMQAVAYDYSEDPEIHYWVFTFDHTGTLIETPKEMWTSVDGDFDWKGSTTNLLKTGETGY